MDINKPRLGKGRFNVDFIICIFIQKSLLTKLTIATDSVKDGDVDDRDCDDDANVMLLTMIMLKMMMIIYDD